jgi:hypothetical protein
MLPLFINIQVTSLEKVSPIIALTILSVRCSLPAILFKKLIKFPTIFAIKVRFIFTLDIAVILDYCAEGDLNHR